VAVGHIIEARRCCVMEQLEGALNEWLLRLIGPADADERRTVGQQFVCGGMSGSFGWGINYPADKAKAIVQVRAGVSAESRAASSFALLRPAICTEGISFLWRGALVTICRGVPFNGSACWCTLACEPPCSRERPYRA